MTFLGADPANGMSGDARSFGIAAVEHYRIRLILLDQLADLRHLGSHIAAVKPELQDSVNLLRPGTYLCEISIGRP